VYCPNCGTKFKTADAGACEKCAMPLAQVAALVAEYRATVPQPEEAPGIPKERLIGAAAFLAIAAIPIGVGVKNGLTKGS
jgi:hypothetical protein